MTILPLICGVYAHCPCIWVSLCGLKPRKYGRNNTLWLLRLDHERLWVFWLVCCNELCDEKFDYAEAFKLERPSICVQLHFPPIFSKVPLVYVQKPPWKWVSRLSCSSSSCWSYPQMRPKILKNRNKLFSVWIHDPQSLWA